MDDMSVESMSKSLVVQAGNLPQHSARVVAPHSTATVDELSKKQLLVLMALFQALLNNTCSPDVRELSIRATCGALKSVMDEEEVKKIARKLMSVRHRNIMDSMF